MWVRCLGHEDLLQLLSLFSHKVMSDSVTPWTETHQASLSFTISWSLLKFTSIKSVIPSSHLILCGLPTPPALNLSQHQGLFPMSWLCIKWPKYWSFSFSISSFQLIFRVDFL